MSIMKTLGAGGSSITAVSAAVNDCGFQTSPSSTDSSLLYGNSGWHSEMAFLKETTCV